MPDPSLIVAVSEKLNRITIELFSSERNYRILRHYESWLCRRDFSRHDFDHAVSRCIADLCGDNGSGERKEPRL